ncbi:Uncharacterised protein [Mycobacteroides abscessus subsp. abscessus]|nr:Uncharacterised protein [Mycobacteroides abscessus subsp. abscessus]
MAALPGEVTVYTALPESPCSAGTPSTRNQPLPNPAMAPQASPVVIPTRHTGRPSRGTTAGSTPRRNPLGSTLLIGTPSSKAMPS